MAEFLRALTFLTPIYNQRLWGNAVFSKNRLGYRWGVKMESLEMASVAATQSLAKSSLIRLGQTQRTIFGDDDMVDDLDPQQFA
jgi:hypothetical protein